MKYKIIIPSEEPYSKVQQKSLELNKKFAENSDLEKIMSEFDEFKQETLEYGLLQHIKMCNECNNESQAVRLLEKYGFEKQQQMYSELVDLLERLTPIYKEDSDLHQKYDKQRLNFIKQFKKK